jgi:phosphopantothenoylcysteine decarboxylase/phosphopantothenate--cysteine ligase
LILIAPASADSLARLAHGHANDLLSTVCLATKAPVLLAPAMNQQMWRHPATQNNLNVLAKNGISLLPTEFGQQACGDIGFGRMLDPDNILIQMQSFLTPKIFNGEHVLLTAGPTQEPIDPVRYLSNHSSGKMGYALAEALQQAGAEVTLISGPTALPPPTVHRIIHVLTAEEMRQAVMTEVASCQLFIATAAVADFKIKQIQPHKIKKSSLSLTLELTINPDILQEVAQQAKRPFIVGFAAETEQLLAHAEEKLKKKNCDLMIANLVTNTGPFHADDNKVWILQKNQPPIELEQMSKQQLAKKLCIIIEQAYAK